MLIFFAVAVGSLQLANHFQEPFMERFALQGGSPGDQPPWYFITRDFAEGICALGALSLSIVVAVITWRWWPSYSSMMVWMSFLWNGGHIAKSWIIGQSCPGLLEGQRITSRWHTFDSYLNDQGIARAQTLVWLSAIVIAVGLPLVDRYFRSRLTQKATCPQNEDGEQ